uniref:Uncharacterized protein n=1 Tax=Alexandrium monilatum TaxID=311494 RepID=A0A7S4QAC5_9DINO
MLAAMPSPSGRGRGAAAPGVRRRRTLGTAATLLGLALMVAGSCCSAFLPAAARPGPAARSRRSAEGELQPAAHGGGAESQLGPRASGNALAGGAAPLLVLALAAAVAYPEAVAAKASSVEQALSPWYSVCPYYGFLFYISLIAVQKNSFDNFNKAYFASAVLWLGPPVVLLFSYKWGG